MDEACDLIAVLKADTVCLQAEVDKLHGVLLSEVSHDYKAESITAKLGRLSLTKTETSEKEADTVNATSEPHTYLL